MQERQNSVEIKTKSAKAINKVSKGKRASQLGLLMLDLGFQPLSRNFKSSIVAAQTGYNQVQAVAANTFLGGLAGAASWLPGVDGDKAADIECVNAILGQRVCRCI